MNLSEVRAAAASRAGIAETDPKYDEIDDWANEALHAIELVKPGGWDWLIEDFETATVAEQAYLAFDTLADVISVPGIRAIRTVEATVGSAYGPPLLELSLREARDRYIGASSSTLLDVIAVEGQRVWFFPTPSDEITLRFNVVVIEPELAEDGDTPRMPAVYHRTWVSATADLVLQSLQRPTEAKPHEEAAARGLTRMLAASRPRTGASRVRRTRSR